MAINIDLLKKYSQESGYKILKEDEEGSSLIIGCTANLPNGKKMEDYAIRVSVYDDGRMFEGSNFNFIDLDLIKQSEYKLQFMFYLLNYAWKTKFGTPEMGKDGEVRFLVEIPLEDNTLTLSQFKKIVEALIQNGVSLAIEGAHLLKTGEEVGDIGGGFQGESAILTLLGKLADTNTPADQREILVGLAVTLVNDPACPSQLKMLLKMAIGTSIPDAI